MQIFINKKVAALKQGSSFEFIADELRAAQEVTDSFVDAFAPEDENAISVDGADTTTEDSEGGDQ